MSRSRVLLAGLSVAAVAVSLFYAVPASAPGKRDGEASGAFEHRDPSRDRISAGVAHGVRFEANEGQAPDGVRFVARASGRTVVFDDGGFALRAGGRVVRIGFAEPGTALTARLTDPVTDVSHYIGESFSAAAVRRYAGLSYDEIAPGVDVRFYSASARPGELEFDFVVAPAGDPEAIALRVEGADELAVDESGRLQIVVGEERVTFGAPITYQPSAAASRAPADTGEGGSDGVRVESAYRLRSDGDVGIDVGPYDRDRELVIDPILVFATYLGGAGGTFIGETAEGVATDAAGNAYVVGFVESPAFPTTPGAYQPACAGATCADGFVAKLDPAGALLFSTYIGGAGDDGLHAVEVSSVTGNIHFVGTAVGAGFPVTPGAFQSVHAGSSDIVVGALDASGSILLVSTLLGGSSSEGTVGIAVDGAGDMYVAGQTNSCDFPTTAGSFQPVDPICGLFDVFVAKVDASGTSLHYSTYLGSPTASDIGFGVDVDAAGNAYVVGGAGPDFPVTAGAFQTVGVGFSGDAFVTKLLPDGSGLVYSTFIGGSGGDTARDVVVDAAGNAYVVGQTGSADFPLVNPWQAATGGGFDAFLAVVDPTGSALVSSSYHGGSGFDGGIDVALEGPGEAWFVGTTSSADFPVVDPIQAANGGNQDAFVARVEIAAPALTFSTYLGGVGFDAGRSTAVAGTVALVAGNTDSVDFPTVAAAQAAYGGSPRDGFAVKIGAGPTEVSVTAPGRINPRSRGVIPVAILTTAGFDATTVDASSATFGPGAAPIAHASGHVADVDGDGDDDLQLHFRTPATGIACGDTSATLQATSSTGTPITATVSFMTVGCR